MEASKAGSWPAHGHDVDDVDSISMLGHAWPCFAFVHVPAESLHVMMSMLTAPEQQFSGQNHAAHCSQYSDDTHETSAGNAGRRMEQPLFAELAAGVSATPRHVKDEQPAAAERQQHAARPQAASLSAAEVLARLSGV